MKPIHRRILLTLSFIGVFALGFIIAAWLLFYEPLRRADLVLGYYSSLEQLDTYLYIQRTLGNKQAYQAALSRYVVELDERRHKEVSDPKVVASKLMVAYTHLGLLAEESDDHVEASRQFTEALKQCRAVTQKQCSVNRLRSLVATLDAQHGAPRDAPKVARP